MVRIQTFGILFGCFLGCLGGVAIADAQNTILPKACVDCHGSEPKFPVRGIRSQ